MGIENSAKPIQTNIVILFCYQSTYNSCLRSNNTIFASWYIVFNYPTDGSTINHQSTQGQGHTRKLNRIILQGVRTCLGSTRGDSNQHQPLFRRITPVVNYLIVRQICCSFKYLHWFSLTYKVKKAFRIPASNKPRIPWHSKNKRCNENEGKRNKNKYRNK